MKKSNIVSVYNTLKNVALGGLSKEDKMTIIKMMVAFKKVVDSYNEEMEVIREKLLTPEVKAALAYVEKHRTIPSTARTTLWPWMPLRPSIRRTRTTRSW